MSRRRRASRRRHGVGATPRTPSAWPSAPTAPLGAPRPELVPEPEPIVVAAPASLVPEVRRSQVQRFLKQRRKQHVLTIVVAILAVIATIAVTAAIITTRGGDDIADVGPVVPSQDTLLLQIRGANGAAAGTVLLAHDDAGGAGVLVPARVIAEVPGAGSMAFGAALALPDESASRRALGDLLGIEVDASWALDRTAFAALVDRVGGVVVDVDVDVLQAVGGGRSAVVIPAGPRQRLAGVQAVQFATYVAPSEQEIAQLPRLQDTMDAILRALPTDAGELTGMLTALPAGATSSIDDAALARDLADLAADVRDDTLTFATLPVIPIDAGSGPTSYRVDATAVRALVETDLAGSVPEGGVIGRPRVYVLNGVGTPGLGSQVRDRLVDSGFAFVGSRNAARLDYRTSQVIVPDSTSESQDLGERVAASLGLPPSTVRVATQGQNVADVIVVVGRDFRP